MFSFCRVVSGLEMTKIFKWNDWKFKEAAVEPYLWTLEMPKEENLKECTSYLKGFLKGHLSE